MHTYHTNVNFLVLKLYYSYIRCNHWWNLSEGCMGSLCIIFAISCASIVILKFKKILQTICSNKQIFLYLPSANLWVTMASLKFLNHSEELRHFRRKNTLTSDHWPSLKLSMLILPLKIPEKDVKIIKRQCMASQPMSQVFWWWLGTSSKWGGGTVSQQVAPFTVLDFNAPAHCPMEAPWMGGQRGQAWCRDQGLS